MEPELKAVWDLKDSLPAIAICISAVALFVSIVTYGLAHRQRAQESRRAARKMLSDVLLLIAQATLELSKYDNRTRQGLQTRRGINSQRRYLTNHASQIAAEFPKAVTDADLNQLALAHDNTDDYEAALHHWKLCLEKVNNQTHKAYYLRGYARFLYRWGRLQDGRKAYEDALRVNLSDDDMARVLHSDTYLLWSLAEDQFGSPDQVSILRERAIAEANRIGQKSRRDYALESIRASHAVSDEQKAEGVASDSVDR